MKILWLSRHSATEEQVADLNRIFRGVEIVQVNKTVSNAQEVADIFNEVGADEMVVVLPPNILADLLNPKLGLPKPIRAVMNREIRPDGEAVFSHSHFERIEKIEIITTRL